MEDIVVGILAIVVGALFCFRGYLAMRFIIPLWGAFAGFMLGAGLVDSFTDGGFLATGLAWVVGLAVALLFGLLAYLYYEVSVVIAMSAIGFVLGSSVTAALGVTWNWLIVLVGLAVGVLLALIAVLGDLPMVLLTVLTALAGASTVVVGIMLVFGTITLADFDVPGTTEQIADDWWWYALYAGLAVIGIVLQVRSTARMRATLRQAWAESGGRELKSA